MAYKRGTYVMPPEMYTKGDNVINSGALSQTETHLYGSNRLGINTLSTNVESGVPL
jgi:hypothetical protein